LRHYFPNDPHARDEFVWPLSGRAERAEADRGDDTTTNRQRNEKLGANTNATIVFGCGGFLRRDVLVVIE
jgi:hypothetical protein